MPNRDIKESCRSSETLALLSHGAERLFWRLTTLADDFGRFDARVAVVRAECFKVMLEKIRTPDVDRWLCEIGAAGLVSLYTVNGRPYGQFVTWASHQRQRASNSKWPSPASADIRPRMPADALEEPVVPENTENTVGGNGRQTPPAAGPPPPTGANGFQIPEAVRREHARLSFLSAVPELRSPPWWQAQARAFPGVDFAAELAKMHAWALSNRAKLSRRKDLARFVHNWFKGAYEKRQESEHLA